MSWINRVQLSPRASANNRRVVVFSTRPGTKMPSLVVWNRQMNIASDDLPFPAALALLCHLALFTLATIVLVLSQLESPSEHHLTVLVTACLMTTSTAGCVVDALICIYGCRGA